MEEMRVRLVFEGHHILSKSQIQEGLKNSWILLKPSHYKTISDLSAYLLRVYHLQHSCPDGITLLMDGFVLPPFESIFILKDKDLVCVRRKGDASTELVRLGNGVSTLGDVHLALGDENLLANEEFEKETGGYESEEEDQHEMSSDALELEDTPVDTVSKKRKGSKKREGAVSKKRNTLKKLSGSTELVKQGNGVSTSGGIHPAVADVKLLANEEFGKETGGYESEQEDQHEVPLDALELEDTPVDTVSKKRKASKKREGAVSKKRKTLKKLSGSKRKKRKLATVEESPVVPGDVENDVHVVNSGSCQLQENGEVDVGVISTPGVTKKRSTRSARRKQLKRRWKREQAKIEKMSHRKQSLTEDNHQSPNDGDKEHSDDPQQEDPKSHDKENKRLSEDQQPDPSGDADDNVVPIVVRPGHIRFEPLGEVDAVQTVQKNQTPVETFQWNGITSKKKGQKWGTEKSAFSRRTYENFNEESCEMLTINEEIAIKNRKDLDFDKLPPYTGSPKKGDVIAYRLIELSSSWTPEPTAFRVGKISWYNSKSNKVMLVPVPKYPITFEKNIDEDEDALQSDTSLYGEDGSLQIDFILLVDVRIVKHGNLNHEKSVSEVCEKDWEAVTKEKDNDDNEKTHAPTQENGKVNPWEEISQVLSAKKAQLSQADDQSTKESSGRDPWSYRALRSSALGPTMAILRSQNEL